MSSSIANSVDYGPKSAWAEEVRALAKQRDAVILAHNYQVPEIQEIAHHVGDSLALSRIAAQVDASTMHASEDDWSRLSGFSNQVLDKLDIRHPFLYQLYKGVRQVPSFIQSA